MHLKLKKSLAFLLCFSMLLTTGAASVFCEGLRRLEGKEVTWENYIAALEEAPIKNPFGGTLDFANGQRMGTTAMYVVKANIDAATGTGWETYQPMATLDEVLAMIK